MAITMNALGAYRPRIALGKTIQKEMVAEYIAGRTGLNEGAVTHVLLELRDTIAYFSLQGHPVRLPGLGIFTPVVLLDGSFKVAVRADAYLGKNLNSPGQFTGEIINREHIGLELADLAALWNASHPEDPIP